MIPYFILLLVVVVGSLCLFKPDKPESRKHVAIFATLVITLFCGSIDALEYGGDIMNYYNNAGNSLLFNYRSFLMVCPFEDGYATFIWLITRLTGSAQGYLYVQYLIMNSAFVWMTCKYSKNPTWGLFFYITLGVFTFYLTALRQGFALAIGIVTLLLLEKGKRIPAGILLIFNFLIHSSSVVLIPFLIFRKKKSKNYLLLGCVVAVAMMIFGDRILSIGNSITDGEYGTNVGRNFSNIGGIINIIIYTATIYILQYSGKFDMRQREDCRDDLMLLMGTVGLAIYTARFRALVMERVAFYFTHAFSVLMPKLMLEQRLFLPRKMFNILVATLSMVLFYVRLNNTFGEYVVFFL